MEQESCCGQCDPCTHTLNFSKPQLQVTITRANGNIEQFTVEAEDEQADGDSIH